MVNRDHPNGFASLHEPRWQLVAASCLFFLSPLISSPKCPSVNGQVFTSVKTMSKNKPWKNQNDVRPGICACVNTLSHLGDFADNLYPVWGSGWGMMMIY